MKRPCQRVLEVFLRMEDRPGRSEVAHHGWYIVRPNHDLFIPCPPHSRPWKVPKPVPMYFEIQVEDLAVPKRIEILLFHRERVKARGPQHTHGPHSLKVDRQSA